MSGFVHLQCHSYYSFLRGTASPWELCAAAKARGMEALALTDLNGLYGAVWFWQAAEEQGIRPILGAEVWTANEKAVLLVQNARGYARLCEILTDRHLQENFSLAPALIQDREGLVILSSDPSLIQALAGAGVRSDLYVALPPGRDDRALLRLGRELGLLPAATGDVYFADPAGYALHRLERAIDLNTTLSRVPKTELAPEPAWLTPPDEIARRLPHCPEALRQAAAIAEQCLMPEPPWDRLIFPAYEGLDSDAAFQLLREKCRAGARERYGGISEAVKQRLDYELEVIRGKGFANYFLVVEDIVRRFPITCGRGSAAASIVSYSLKITHVDPIAHNLFFERFLNPGRKDPPDIDVDFPWDERDGVLDYVFQKYGAQGAAMVSNHVSFQARAAVREVAKVYGLPDAEIMRVTKRMRHFWGTENAEELVRTHPMFQDLKLEPPWPEILKLAVKLEGIPKNLSVHCGGVVIAPGELTRRAPLERAAKGVNIIHWEKDQTEDAGLVKIDLLGNRSLAVIRDALAAIKTNYGLDYPYASFNPLDDPETQARLARGDTIGVFYVESPAMRQLQQKCGTGDFERLVVHSSIIRPAANTYIREYVRRLRGGAYEPLHPLLEDLLRETFGIMCYQEDVCKTAMALAGFDAVDGDGLRKILSKKHRAKKLAEYREQFFRGARARGVAEEVIEKIWDMILSFSGYSFCKPHSASYALVSFKSAWLRAHYPAEFMAAVISNQGGYYSTFAYISEARRMGLAVLPPEINASEEAYTGQDKNLRVGLMQIKGLSQAGLAALLDERRRGRFRSFADFLFRVNPTPADARRLTLAGCFDEVEPELTRPALLWRLAEHGSRRKQSSAPSLFEPPPSPLPKPAGYDEQTLLRQEVETLGFLVSRHPLTLYQTMLKPRSWVPAQELGRWVEKRVTTIGWYVTGKPVETKDGEPMEFLSFEDTTAIYETTFFPETYRRFCHLIDRERPYLLEGKVEEDFGAISLTVDRVRFLEGGRGKAGAQEKRLPAVAFPAGSGCQPSGHFREK
jgi:error-prone DNA polymerase